MCSKSEVCTLFNTKYPEYHVFQTTVRKTFHKFEEHGTVKYLPICGRPHVSHRSKTRDCLISVGRFKFGKGFIVPKQCCAYMYVGRLGDFLKH